MTPISLYSPSDLIKRAKQIKMWDSHDWHYNWIKPYSDIKTEDGKIYFVSDKNAKFDHQVFEYSIICMKCGETMSNEMEACSLQRNQEWMLDRVSICVGEK